MAKLCIVPTPIGNLEDITLRALRMLKQSDLIFAEDTRVTRVLLSHFDIHKKLLSFHSNNEHAQLQEAIRQIQAHEQVALVSDAGTPGISDPGFLLVRACIKHGIEVECLPGPTAFVPALVASGLPADKFFFEGFLPHKKGRQTRLEFLATLENTVILYESPYRLIKTLQQIAQFMGGQRRVSVAKEISKMYEMHYRGTVEDALAYFTNLTVKGEFVIVVGKDSKLSEPTDNA
ncbi:MAG: 16S rRNA (cytidine(1402)-2'-O)-methyltransferase [Bacteroidota bacterium]